MNLILIFEKDFVGSHVVRLEGRRFAHVQEILKAAEGKELIVGRVNGLIGRGRILSLKDDSMEMEVAFQEQPPAPLNVSLIMALPRPPMLRRSLQCAASLGIKKIIIFNSSRVEKSFWQSSRLKTEAVLEDLMLGLEQARDTVLPEVLLKTKFKAFIEDDLPFLIKGKDVYLAHPGEGNMLTRMGSKEAVLIIGPEGGFSDYEVELIKSKGATAVNLGQRILRFENVIPFAVGKLTTL